MGTHLSKLFYQSWSRFGELLLPIIALGGLVTSIAPGAYAGTQAVSVTIQQNVSPDSLDSTFNGFSYEKNTLASPLVSADNAALVALYAQLGHGVLRSGGDSVDQVIWDPNGPGLINGKVSPVDIDRIAAFLRATNWKIIYALNFSVGTRPVTTLPSAAAVSAAAVTAAQEAAYVASAFGDHLIGFEIGNEPGNFVNNGLRPATYTFADYEAEWETFAAAIRSEVPSAQLVGPADQGYTPPFITSLGSQVALVTDHYYRGKGQGSSYLQQLLTIDPYLVNTMLPTVDSLSEAIPVGYRMGECNSFSQPLTEGNVFAEALWAIDFEFINALNHSTGVNFHPVPGIAPIDVDYSEGIVTSVNPLFYAMKLFSMAAKGTLLRTAVSAQQTTFSAYAVAGNDGSTYVVLSNKDGSNAVEASIEFMQPISSATSTLLTAPSLTSTSGVTLGGAPIGIDGRWSATQINPVVVSNGAATVTMPPGSAALIKALPVTTSIGIPYDGLCVGSTQETSGPFIYQLQCDSTSQGQAFAFVPTSDGYFNIRPQNSNLCLDRVNPALNILQHPCGHWFSQKWSLLLNSDNTYSVATANDRYCLDVEAASTTQGAPIITGQCKGTANQEVSLSNPPLPPLRTSSSIVTVSYDNLCMDIWHQTYSVGPYVQQHACTGELNQSFALASTTDGYYTVFSNMNKLCLDAPAGSSTVFQNICTGGSSQKWQLTSNSDATYTFSNANSQSCLGILNASTASGALFEVSACDGGSDQKLKLATPPTTLAQPQ